MYSAGSVALALFVIHSFLLINTERPILIGLSIIVALGIIYPAIYAPLASFWSELFNTRVRYTGVGSVYQFSGVFASGLTPLIAASLIALGGGSPWFFIGYLLIVAVISLTACYFLPETYHKDITPTGELAEKERAQSRAAEESGSTVT